MNWLDKHGSAVTAIATTVLTAITAYYACHNRKYVKLIEEDRRRQQEKTRSSRDRQKL